MNYYERMIVEDTGCSVEESGKVETVMRLDVFHSTLDWQSRAEFRRGAREAWRLMNERREDYEEYFRQCRASLGLPAEAGPSGPPARPAGLPDAATELPEDPPVLWEQKQTILDLVIFRQHRGGAIEQGCRFHVAPCEDGRWFAWAEAHQPADDPEPCDALYDFYDATGRSFASRTEALAAIYEFGAEFCQEEADTVTEPMSAGSDQ